MSKFVTVGAIEKSPDDGLDAIRARLATDMQMPAVGSEPEWGGKGGKPIKYESEEILNAVNLFSMDDDVDVRPAETYAWAIADKAGIREMMKRFPESSREKEFTQDRLSGIDPSDPKEICFAIGRKPGEPFGYMHATRKVTLDKGHGSGDADPRLNYWLKLETVYIAPMERGRRASYVFGALVRDVTLNELLHIVEKGKPLLPSLDVTLFASTEVEDVPDNRLMRRIGTTLKVVRDLLHGEFEDGQFDVSFDHDNVPIMFAQPRF